VRASLVNKRRSASSHLFSAKAPTISFNHRRSSSLRVAAADDVSSDYFFFHKFKTSCLRALKIENDCPFFDAPRIILRGYGYDSLAAFLLALFIGIVSAFAEDWQDSKPSAKTELRVRTPYCLYPNGPFL
jgi:hypothetical protein